MPWYEVLGIAVAAWIVMPPLIVVILFAVARVFDYRVGSAKH